MAGGFDSTAFGVGLVGNLNRQMETARENQQKGELDQVSAFQEAQKEFDQSNSKAQQEKTEIENMAKDIASQKGRDPALSDYATARSAINAGFKGPEHLQYVLKAADNAYQDMQSNPQKWQVDPNPSKVISNDSDPYQTSILNKYGIRPDVSKLENVRQHNVTNPYSGLPGVNMGNPEDTKLQNEYNQKLVGAKATQDVANANSGWPSENQPAGMPTNLANNNPAQAAATSNINASSQAPDQSNPLAMPASSLQPPSSPMPQGAGGGQSIPPPPSPQMTPSPQMDNTPPHPVQPPIAGPADGKPSYGEDQSGQKLNWDYLHSLPNSIQNNVKGIADGTMNITDVIPRSMGGNSQQLRQRYFDAVKTFDPSWDENNYAARRSAQVGLANPNSKTGQILQSTNKLAQHLDRADKNIDKLPNLNASGQGLMEGKSPSAMDVMSGNAKPVNEQQGEGMGVLTGLQNDAIRAYHKHSGTGAYTAFEEDKTAIGEESERLWRGTGGNVATIHEWNKNLDSANTPQELHAALGELVGLVQGQVNSIQDTHDRILGPHAKDVLSPQTRAIYNKLYQKTNPGQDLGAAQFNTPSEPSSDRKAADYSSLWKAPSGQQQ